MQIKITMFQWKCAGLWGLYTLYIPGDRIDFTKNKYLLQLDGIFSNENVIGFNNIHKEYFIIKQVSKSFRNYFSELEQYRVRSQIIAPFPFSFFSFMSKLLI